MNHDQTTLDPDVEVTAHGCGEYFPLDETGEYLDSDAKNGERDQMDRRVEVFFFDRTVGVQPPPPSKTSKRGTREYPEWRARARLIADQRLGGRILMVRLHGRTLRPLDVVPYSVTIGATRFGPRESRDGWAEIILPENVCPDTVLLEWGTPPEGSSDEFAYSREIVPSCSLPTEGEEDDAMSQSLARARLHNLGYDCDCDAAFFVAARLFQLDYQVPEIGLDDQRQLPPATLAKLRALYKDSCDASTESTS